jgi:Na+-transporting methylmalonyl-CoA/oxaloacetate decarboxylase gamma subunit
MLPKITFVFLFFSLLMVACSGTSTTESTPPTQPPVSEDQSAPSESNAEGDVSEEAEEEPASSGEVEPVEEAQEYPEPPAEAPAVNSTDLGAYPAPGEYPLSGFEPVPEDDKLQRGEVFLNLETSELFVLESTPTQVSLMLRGELPTPCNQLRVVIAFLDNDNRIEIEVYSVVDPNEGCITVIEPFEANIPMGQFTGGTYSIYVNGELLGEFDS